MPDAPPAEPRAEVEVTPAPPLMLGVMWVGAFSVVLWGMFLLFGTRGSWRSARTPAPDDDTDPP